MAGPLRSPERAMYGRTGEFLHMNDFELSSKEKSPMMGETVDPEAYHELVHARHSSSNVFS